MRANERTKPVVGRKKFASPRSDFPHVAASDKKGKFEMCAVDVQRVAQTLLHHHLRGVGGGKSYRVTTGVADGSHAICNNIIVAGRAPKSDFQISPSWYSDAREMASSWHILSVSKRLEETCTLHCKKKTCAFSQLHHWRQRFRTFKQIDTTKSSLMSGTVFRRRRPPLWPFILKETFPIQ